MQLLLMMVVYVSKFKSQTLRQTMEEEIKWDMGEDAEEKKDPKDKHGDKINIEIAN